MADKISPERRSQNMRAIRSKNTKPEMIVRRVTHALGYRFRLHRSDLPGKPDLIFPSRRKAIFVHGCFWHQHPKDDCRDARPPRSNQGYWGQKLLRNTERDKKHTKELRKLGWQVMTIWECETDDLAAIRSRIENFLS